MNLTHRYKTQTCLSGSILLSHPSLKDPSFHKSVVFLSAHSEDAGTIGVILNRPLNRTLDELDDQFRGNPYGSIPVFEGGPVETDKIIVAAWEWSKQPSSFKLYFGIEKEVWKAFFVISLIVTLIWTGITMYNAIKCSKKYSISFLINEIKNQ